MEYIQIQFRYAESIQDIKREVWGYMVEKGYNFYSNMLQMERAKEAGLISNSYISMDLLEIKDILENKLGCKVGIRYKAIYRGK